MNSQLKTSNVAVDISHYRSVLKNQAVVDEAEKILKNFKPVTYDVSEHVKAIEAFEAKAVCEISVVRSACITDQFLSPSSLSFHSSVSVLQVSKAEETAQKIDAELKDLQATLANIEEARPFEELTVGRFQSVLALLLLIFAILRSTMLDLPVQRSSRQRRR